MSRGRKKWSAPPLPSSAAWDRAEPWWLPRTPRLHVAPDPRPPAWSIIMSSGLFMEFFVILNFLSSGLFLILIFFSSWLFPKPNFCLIHRHPDFFFSQNVPLYLCLQGSPVGFVLSHDHSLLLLEQRVLALQSSSWKGFYYRFCKSCHLCSLEPGSCHPWGTSGFQRPFSAPHSPPRSSASPWLGNRNWALMETGLCLTLLSISFSPEEKNCEQSEA